jgi:hypothetical protein
MGVVKVNLNVLARPTGNRTSDWKGTAIFSPRAVSAGEIKAEFCSSGYKGAIAEQLQFVAALFAIRTAA